MLRTRTVKDDASIDELTAATREGVLPIVRAIPGFVEYYVIQNVDTRERTGVSIFTDKVGADETTRQVGEFIASEGIADHNEDVEPIVVEGEIVTAAVQGRWLWAKQAEGGLRQEAEVREPSNVAMKWGLQASGADLDRPDVPLAGRDRAAPAARRGGATCALLTRMPVEPRARRWRRTVTFLPRLPAAM